MKIGSLCTGYGGLEHAAEQHYNATTAWHAENASAPSRVLAHHHPDTPNHGDLNTLDWTSVEPVDIVTAGYPCQPFSSAGHRKGTNDPRHLWPAIAVAISILRPRNVILENVAAHLTFGFESVLADLAGLGYDARWGVVRASDAGAPHQRARLFVVATDSADDGRERRGPARRGRPGPSHRDPTLADADDGAGRSRLAQLDRPAPAGQHGASGRHADGRGDDPSRGPDALPADTAGERRRRRADVERPDDAQTQRSEEGAHARGRDTSWGDYEPAIRRWEAVLGRVAPPPTTPGRNGRARLNAAFSEWLLGLPAGYVTSPDIGLTRAEQLRVLGNGVVPHQALLALRLLDPNP